MDVYRFPIEEDPAKPNRYLLCLELQALSEKMGNPIESGTVFTLEEGDSFERSVLAQQGGVIIPLHGHFQVECLIGQSKQEVEVRVNTTAEPFAGFVLHGGNEHVTIRNLSGREGHVLCFSGNNLPLLEGRHMNLSRIDLFRNLPVQPTWVYVNNMTSVSTPAGNHYHTKTHELLVPIYGAFSAHLLDVATGKHTQHLLMPDSNAPEDTSLYVPPGTAHAVVKRSKNQHLARLLVLSTSSPRSDDDIEHILVPLS